MLQKFIPIAAFTAATDAAIARGLLEAGGIECRVQEERLSPNTPRYKDVNRKWFVQVQRRDVAKSMRLLKDKGRLRSEDFCISKWELLRARIRCALCN
jgi:hypothetical protein